MPGSAYGLWKAVRNLFHGAISLDWTEAALRWPRLGRVDGFDEDECEGEGDERYEARSGLLAA